MNKSLIALLFCLLLALTLVGCAPQATVAVATSTAVPPTTVPTVVPPTATVAPTEAPAEVTMFDGIYEKRFTPPGYDEYVGYFHFYENGIVYISLYNNGQYMAGFYEIVDEGVGWDPTQDDGKEIDTSEATTDKKIVITNFDGSEYAVVGYDSEKDMVVNLESYYNMNFTHVLDSGHTEADETGVNVIEYYKPGDEYSLVALKHNGTFEDSIGEVIEGTWTKDGSVYTLKPEDLDKTYTVTVNEDGTASYTALDGTTQTLELPKTAEVKLTFAGTLKEAAYGEMKGTTYLYADDTAKLVIEYAGTTNEFEGAWKLNADYSITVSFDGKDFTIPLDAATRSFGAFEYATSDGTADVKLVMEQVAEEAAVKYTWVGTSNPKVVLEMYSDGSAKLNYEGMGTVTQGTWSIDTSAGPLPAWTITLDETFENKPIEVTTDYKTAFSFVFKNGSGQLEETLSLGFDAYQAVQQ